MRKFYEVYGDLSNLPPTAAKLPWTHNSILVEKIDNNEFRALYAQKCLDNGWNKVVLDHQIDLCLYERQADNNKKIRNFEATLPVTQSELATDMMKDPYIFELANLKEKALEKDVEESMLNSVKNVLMEFGNGFSFVGNQYRISTNDNDYFIDLLFYHLHLRCYVVAQLKVVDFKPEFLGQLQFYITAVDETLKHEFDNPTIGLLLCKSKDKVAAEWALKSTNAPVGVASYEIRRYLPSEDEIIKYLNLEENK